MIDSFPHEKEQFLRAIRSPKQAVFLSLSAYALGKTMGIERAMAELNRQIEEPSRALRGVRSLHRLKLLATAGILFDTGATHIGKTRSRHFDLAWKSTADAWISVDDDVEITAETALYLLQALNDYEPRIVVVPVLLRAELDAVPTIGVKYPQIICERRIGAGRLVRCESAGFGCVGMNRPAMAELCEVGRAEGLEFLDDDGVIRLALFAESFRKDAEGVQRWYGEDLSFFARVPSSVTVEALLTGHSNHAGLPLALESAHFSLSP